MCFELIYLFINYCIVCVHFLLLINRHSLLAFLFRVLLVYTCAFCLRLDAVAVISATFSTKNRAAVLNDDCSRCSAKLMRLQPEECISSEPVQFVHLGTIQFPPSPLGQDPRQLGGENNTQIDCVLLSDDFTIMTSSLRKVVCSELNSLQNVYFGFFLF